MGGMGRPLQAGNPLIVSAFHTTLIHQALLLLGIITVVALTVNVVRTVQSRRLVANGHTTFPASSPWLFPEPSGRRILRVGFGILWIVDGLLQLQNAMPLSLPSSVVQPAAGTSPQWVKDLVNSGATIWSNHPVQAAAGVVWIEVGLGIWLLVAPRGRWSRAGGLATVGWSVVVWVFGEAFGGVFAPGLSWLFGAPGAALLYGAAGIVLTLPDRFFASPRLGRVMLGLTGVFFVAMAVLQAWPGRGFWQGRIHGSAHLGTLAAMVRQMAQTPQPAFLSSWVAAFGTFDAAHGWAVNLVIVVGLAAIGVTLCRGRPRLVLVASAAATVLCLADWVLVEDLGFLGGVGTDPNSMLPLLVVLVAGYVALVRVPVPVEVAAPVAEAGQVTSPRWWEAATPGYVVRAGVTVAALAIVVVGSTPVLGAATNPNADPIISETFDGTPNVLDIPAPTFRLVDQHGTDVSLTDLRGHTVALTFLDPVCTTDCPLIAQNFREADRQLGAKAATVDFVAIVANPVYRSLSFVDAFDRQEGLNHVTNWFFLTGSVAQLRQVWDSYGVLVATEPAGSMVAHGDLAYVIDGRGRERDALDSDPGPDAASSLSFASLLSERIGQTLHS